MRPVPALAAVLVAAGLAGCATPPADPVSRLREAWGPEAVGVDGPSVTLSPAVLEARFVRDGAPGEWSTAPVLRADAERVVLEKPDPGAAAGGGVERTLEARAVPATLEVRLREAGRLGDFAVRWGTQAGVDAAPAWEEPRAASEPFVAAMTGPGALFVAAELRWEDRPVGATSTPLAAAIDAAWAVESRVHPAKAADAAEPPNYADMADAFRFRTAAEVAALEAESRFRGAWDRTQGTDIDLELDDAAGAAHVCVGANGGGTPSPDPEHAHERLRVERLPAGDWTLRVGAARISGNCFGTMFYDNPAPVPYTLELRLRYA